jgi:hypothetical protein
MSARRALAPFARTLALFAPVAAPAAGSGAGQAARNARAPLLELGSSSVTTGSDGEATIAAPATSGRYTLAASASGDVPSFPRALLVQ